MTRPARLPPGVQQCLAPPTARPANAVVAPRWRPSRRPCCWSPDSGTAAGMSLGAASATADAAAARTAGSPVGAAEGNVVTPGDFTGYGFDQCHAPDQRSMNKWLTHSPFLAVGIYISGNSRACRDQPNLTPQWISTQLAKGWRLLPITLGPQASCQPRFPRYDDDPKINPKRGTDGLYQWAREQGTAEATKTVTDAQALGIVAGQHALVRPRGLQRHPHRLPRVGAGVPVDLDRPAARARLHVRRLLQRRLRHRDARRRAGRAARPVQPAGRRSGSPAGTSRPTPRRRTSVRTAGCRAAG